MTLAAEERRTIDEFKVAVSLIRTGDDGFPLPDQGLEIVALGNHPRPGLAATAIALARILDNPKAVSTQPAAAAALMTALAALRKSAVGSKPKLASVRQMTTSGR